MISRKKEEYTGGGLLARSIPALIGAVLILSSLLFVSHAQVEYEPGERMAEMLYERGIGGPWIMSEKHPELYAPPKDDATPYGATEFSLYSDYFSMDAPAAGGTVAWYSISGQEPTALYTGGPSGRSFTYSEYQSTYGGLNALWIQGSTSWTRYVVCPVGAYLRLLAYSSGRGLADFYEIDPGGRLSRDSYRFDPGYNRLATFHADEVGRHVLLFVVDNRPSNVVIVDVRKGVWPPSPTPPSGYATVILRASKLRGYSVFVDGSYVGADGESGDLQDGIYRLTLPGDRYRTITITCMRRTYTERGTFLSGYSYALSI